MTTNFTLSNDLNTFTKNGIDYLIIPYLWNDKEINQVQTKETLNNIDDKIILESDWITLILTLIDQDTILYEYKCVYSEGPSKKVELTSDELNQIIDFIKKIDYNKFLNWCGTK